MASRGVADTASGGNIRVVAGSEFYHREDEVREAVAGLWRAEYPDFPGTPLERAALMRSFTGLFVLEGDAVWERFLSEFSYTMLQRILRRAMLEYEFSDLVDVTSVFFADTKCEMKTIVYDNKFLAMTACGVCGGYFNRQFRTDISVGVFGEPGIIMCRAGHACCDRCRFVVNFAGAAAGHLRSESMVARDFDWYSNSTRRKPLDRCHLKCPVCQEYGPIYHSTTALRIIVESYQHRVLLCQACGKGRFSFEEYYLHMLGNCGRLLVSCVRQCGVMGTLAKVVEHERVLDGFQPFCFQFGHKASHARGAVYVCLNLELCLTNNAALGEPFYGCPIEVDCPVLRELHPVLTVHRRDDGGIRVRVRCRKAHHARGDDVTATVSVTLLPRVSKESAKGLSHRSPSHATLSRGGCETRWLQLARHRHQVLSQSDLSGFPLTEKPEGFPPAGKYSVHALEKEVLLSGPLSKDALTVDMPRFDTVVQRGMDLRIEVRMCAEQCLSPLSVCTLCRTSQRVGAVLTETFDGAEDVMVLECLPLLDHRERRSWSVVEPVRQKRWTFAGGARAPQHLLSRHRLQRLGRLRANPHGTVDDFDDNSPLAWRRTVSKKTKRVLPTVLERWIVDEDPFGEPRFMDVVTETRRSVRSTSATAGKTAVTTASLDPLGEVELDRVRVGLLPPSGERVVACHNQLPRGDLQSGGGAARGLSLEEDTPEAARSRLLHGLTRKVP